jgi:hypothetical protein
MEEKTLRPSTNGKKGKELKVSSLILWSGIVNTTKKGKRRGSKF